MIDKGRETANKFGFMQVSTPIVEELDLFVRAIGTETDVVSKELFSWSQNVRILHKLYNKSKTNKI